MNAYTPGQTVVISGTFTDPVTGAGLTPSSLKLRIIDPSGAETDIVSGFGNPQAGQYTSPIVASIPGLWQYRWRATGAIVAASENGFLVNASDFSAD